MRVISIKSKTTWQPVLMNSPTRSHRSVFPPMIHGHWTNSWSGLPNIACEISTLLTKRKTWTYGLRTAYQRLHKNVVEVQTRISDLPPTDPAELGLLPAEHGELEKLSATLKKHLEAKDAEINTRENGESSAETTIAQKRNEEMAAKQALAACKATAKNSREELQRLPAEEQILQRIDAAERALQEAAEQLRQTELTDKEMTIHERLDAAQQSFTALEQQIRATAEKYNVIKGRLQESEGLHAKRSSTAARVEELTRLTEIESLEKDAVDRLYALFEECRDKQLGTVMEPIHNRVLSWMCGLDIGNYGEVRFNDAFLPDKLVSRDGTSEFALHEESTGAQEQIGMLVRLALDRPWRRPMSLQSPYWTIR